MEYMYFPIFADAASMYGFLSIAERRSAFNYGFEGPSERLVHEYSDEVIIAE